MREVNKFGEHADGVSPFKSTRDLFPERPVFVARSKFTFAAERRGKLRTNFGFIGN